MVCTTACTQSFSLGKARRMTVSADMLLTIQGLGHCRVEPPASDAPSAPVTTCRSCPVSEIEIDERLLTALRAVLSVMMLTTITSQLLL